MSKLKVIVSGGGTGGHIFPAIAIANALKLNDDSIDILFVGAKGKMEMEKVPNAGYPIIGLPITGFQRNLSDKRNVFFPFKLLYSLIKSLFIVLKFKPNIVVGTGGYASGPLLFVASKMGIPSLIQEQNSYPGITNKLLSKITNKICVAYPGMEKFFPKEKILFSGNPIRQDLQDISKLQSQAYDHFKFDNSKTTVLVVGGSLGALTINNTMEKFAKKFPSGVQMLWQTGTSFYGQAANYESENIRVMKFISRMDLAYSLADVVISRAGASTISELCLVAKPSILVPSPNVSEDHQTKNALALKEKDAALLVKDVDSINTLIPQLQELIENKEKRVLLSKNIYKLAKLNSAQIIAQELINLTIKK
ncbi:MAG: undecaprenyldiphospho-muramoylpentapeptide beta-N-acetylglucosaminyltransferase [Flavobacteriales bacterium]|jgi:UDP-N-acetylglucosamine--N-acetylmuramyl-(pentapeptide) pyrophosphoryl-undecaprenol N-acetylglucosamine transferase|tara:strand:- start:554 stop:1648 length:1095 start_codon:yes stop_codon:yes gene_type:complete